MTDFDKARLEAFLETLGEAADRLNEVRFVALNEAIVAEFGSDGISEEEMEGVAKATPLIVKIDEASDLIEKKISAVRAQLTSDGTLPPF